MAGAIIRQMAYDDCQPSLLCELRKMFSIPNTKTVNATPSNPERKTSMDSRASQFFPKAMKSNTPIRNAQISEKLDMGLWMFIYIVPPNYLNSDFEFQHTNAIEKFS
jgi:hypothetical protein